MWGRPHRTFNLSSLLPQKTTSPADTFFYCCCLQRPETGPPGIITAGKQCGGTDPMFQPPAPPGHDRPRPPFWGTPELENRIRSPHLSVERFFPPRRAVSTSEATGAQATPMVPSRTLMLRADVSSTISQTAASWLMNLDLFSSLQKRPHCPAEVRCVQMLEEALPVHLQTRISPG